MTEILGGLITMGGGGMMVAGAMQLLASSRAAELIAALPFTPVPPADVALDALLTSID